MAWNFPLLSSVFGGPGQAVSDWWNKYQWVVYIIIILVVLFVIAYIVRAFR